MGKVSAVTMMVWPNGVILEYSAMVGTDGIPAGQAV
jgi:hypothetical protein